MKIDVEHEAVETPGFKRAGECEEGEVVIHQNGGPVIMTGHKGNNWATINEAPYGLAIGPLTGTWVRLDSPDILVRPLAKGEKVTFTFERED
jgi:hypothetical protein